MPSDFSIKFENGKFYAEGSLPASEMRRAKWFVFSDEKRARTARFDSVEPFIAACDAGARKIVEEKLSAKALAVHDSFAAHSDIDVPAPPGMVYRPYQLAGIAYMASRWGCLNADVPRLGKTIQSYGLVNTYKPRLRVLAIVPANAKVGWEREGKKWLAVPHSIGVAYGDDLPETDVVIINYELLARHEAALRAQPWDIVIIDEAHNFGSKKSKRTKFAMSLAPSLHFVFLTGTPAFTRPAQLWPMVEKMDPHGLGRNWMTFVRRYCAAKKDPFGRWDTSGYSNLEELQFKMRQAFMVRREKCDVLDELPPMRKTLYLPATGLKRLIATERSAMQNNLAKLMEMIQAGGVDENDPSFKALADNQGIKRKDAEARKELALRKVPMVVDFVRELLETEDKVVVFYHHRDPLAAFYDNFDPSEIARVWGGMTTTKREEERVRFQEEDSCRVFVGNLQAASAAIELSSADSVVFAEFSRAVPSEFDQAEERPWLPTKEAPISIYNLVVEGSIEEDIAEVLEYRRANLDRLTCRANLV